MIPHGYEVDNAKQKERIIQPVNIYIPPSFEEVTEQEFEYLMGNLNVRRDAFCDGEYYYAEGRRYRIGVHTTSGRWYVDNEFFPKANRV